MIAKINSTSVMADNQCVIISSAKSIAISAENPRSDIHTHGMTPPTSVVAVNVTAMPEVAIARLIAASWSCSRPVLALDAVDHIQDVVDADSHTDRGHRQGVDVHADTFEADV